MAFLNDKGRLKLKLSTGANLIVRNLFGKQYVQLYDGQYTMNLNSNLPKTVFRSCQRIVLFCTSTSLCLSQ